MRLLILSLSVLVSTMISTVSIAQETTLSVVAVGDATEEKETIVFHKAKLENFTKSGYAPANQILEVWRNDFSFYKHKFIVKELENKEKFGITKMEDWKKEGFRFVVSSKFINFPKEKYVKLLIKVYDVQNQKEVFSYDDIASASGKTQRAFAHTMADNIYKSMTGKKSIFNGKIIFVSDKLSSSKKVIKELYMMDFDGKNIVPLTSHRSIVISPSISPDNKKVLYSVIKVKNGRQNVDLYMMDLKTKKHSLLSAKKGINSGGVFSLDGTKVYLTLSYTGNADIYELTVKTGALRRVTSHFADDVDPSISGDGKIMAFLSGRPGRAMIYTLDPQGKEKGVKRISFVGKFNATPRFAPDGSEIAFSSWVDNRFDIYRIDSDGRNLVRLTKNFGSNEEPSYSNDGEFITFSSQRVLSRRKAIQNLYIMTRDGEILGNITQDFGACTSPRWSN